MRLYLSRLLTPALLIVSALLAGCAGSRSVAPIEAPIPSRFPHHTVSEILENMRLRPDTLQGFDATANVSMRTPLQSGSFSAEISHRRDDSLYMKIKAALGIEAARTLITPDSFFVYDRINRQLLFGPRLYAQAFLPAPLVEDELFSSMLGLFAPEPETPWRVEADEDYYYLSDPQGRRSFVIDPRIWRVIRYEEKSPSGTILEDRVYSEHDLFDGWYLPRRIVYRRPAEDTFLSVYYRTIDLNPPDQTFALRVDGDVRRVPLFASH